MRAGPGKSLAVLCAASSLLIAAATSWAAQVPSAVGLPDGVRAVWDLGHAWCEATPTRERVSINGLWRWQPAALDPGTVPAGEWGWFKVPGYWPGTSSWIQKDSQTVHAHPAWKDRDLAGIRAAWYERDVTVPEGWAGRRIILAAEYVNSLATVHVDGKQVGVIRFPAGEVDLTAVCRPGGTYRLSLHVVAMPLKAVLESYRDTAAARTVKGSVSRRGLCGDVYLASTPKGARLGDVKVETSVRNGRLRVSAAVIDAADDATYVLESAVLDGDRTVHRFTGPAFKKADLEGGRITVTEKWKPNRLWDVHTPQHMYRLRVSLRKAGGDVCDAGLPVRFGFREFWIDGRDFTLNGTRIYLSALPMANAQVGAAWATYDAARETMERLKAFGINFVYTHHYGCQPGDHVSFEEVLRAADDVGMLVGFSQPHFSHYDWDAADADRTNGYARHAAFYVRVAQNHPSVVAYATSHNATGYSEDMNPDLIDGIHAPRSEWAVRNVRKARRAAAVIRGLDPTRIVYHHASGNLGPMHLINYYPNFVPIQEMSDWFGHWGTKGVKPLFTCEYCAPMPWDWTMYRGWYKGHREFGSAVVPWEFCVAEWNAQFLGDRAYRISDAEKENLRWEAERFRAGRPWHRWDYPHVVGSSDLRERYPVYAMYFAENWPAFRTWGVSAVSPWNHGHYWTLRDGVDTGRKDLPVDWEHLARPGFSPDYVDERPERIDLAYARDDWVPTAAAKALHRYNMPLLAWLAGKPGAFTSQDHNVTPGETVEKQLIVINNSRAGVTADASWSLALPTPLTGRRKVTIPTGEQARIPLRFDLPADLAPGRYDLSAAVRFSTGETQKDAFTLDVLPKPAAPRVDAKVALFDPKGETADLLKSMGVAFRRVEAGAPLSARDVLVVGKGALTVRGPAPDVSRVREGLRVLIFEQTPQVLAQRFGFRVASEGFRRVFSRVPDHPALAGLEEKHLRNWRGEATVLPPRLDYELSPEFNGSPAVRWCGILVTRLWRCGNRGNVASVAIEKPPRGDFLPILDAGYSLQYSPLLAYREGRGLVLFCQMDVTGRTESDPAAETLARRVLEYVGAWKPSPRRKAVYVGGDAGRRHLEAAGIHLSPYKGGKPAGDAVLVVGPAGGRALAPHAEALAGWIKAGGHVLALGLAADEANAFLPKDVTTKRGEHIAAWFEPFGHGSPLSGVAPADVHNAAPRKVPLLTGDAAIAGGVLGRIPGTHVVFCQFPPWTVTEGLKGKPWTFSSTISQHNLKRTYRRTSFCLARLLAGMGVAAATPVLERFSTPVADGPGKSLAKNGDFASDEDGDGVPDGWTFTSSAKQAACRREKAEGAASAAVLTCPPADGEKPPSVMLAQNGVPVEKGRWYRLSFQAQAPRLEAANVTVTVTDTTKWKSLIGYQRFVPEPAWQTFRFDVESNGTVETKTRLQFWWDGAGEVWLRDVRVQPIPDPREGRWLTGLYLDRPEEWDDPYRFFRW